MSYEGFVQLIGSCGHKWEIRSNIFSYGNQAAKVAARTCPACGATAGCYAEVDVTNGYGKEYGEWAVRAPMTPTGFTDEWKVDHYGNRHAVRHETFKPRGKRWSVI